MQSPKQQINHVIISCDKCQKRLIWPLQGWQFRVVGLIQFRCLTCGQVISFPAEEVWGLAEKQDIENTTARLLGFDETNKPPITKTDDPPVPPEPTYTPVD